MQLVFHMVVVVIKLVNKSKNRNTRKEKQYSLQKTKHIKQ